VTFVTNELSNGNVKWHPKLVLVALCAMVLTGCAQFEDCPGSPPGSASYRSPPTTQIRRIGHHRREMRIRELMDRQVMGRAGVSKYMNEVQR
jgi:hypothetical protein